MDPVLSDTNPFCTYKFCHYTIYVLTPIPMCTHITTQIRNHVLIIFYTYHMQPDLVCFLQIIAQKNVRKSYFNYFSSPITLISLGLFQDAQIPQRVKTYTQPSLFIFTPCSWQHLANLFSADMFKGLRIMFKSDHIPCGAS